LEKIYNVGIIGFGFMGKTHAYGYLSIPFYYDPIPIKTKLFGVCTSKKETVQKAKEKYGFDFATTDYKELIEHPKVDIIHICSPNIFHKEQLLYAIRAGKHIYCDKPLVCNLDEAREIAEALKNYDKIAQIAFQYRFYPATMKAKELIEEGFVGVPISFRFSYYHSGSLDPLKPMGWKQEKSFGGGVLLDLGSHIIDLLYFFLGEYESVMGVSKILYQERVSREDPKKKEKVEAEDFSLMLAKMKCGTIGSLEVSKITAGSNDDLKFEIYGTEGAIRFNLMQPNFLEVYSLKDEEGRFGGPRGFKLIETVQRYPKPAVFPGEKFSIGWIRGHIHCLYNFLESIRDNRQSAPSVYDGIYNIQVIEAIRKSELLQSWTKVELIRGEF